MRSAETYHLASVTTCSGSSQSTPMISAQVAFCTIPGRAAVSASSLDANLVEGLAVVASRAASIVRASSIVRTAGCRPPFGVGRRAFFTLLAGSAAARPSAIANSKIAETC